MGNTNKPGYVYILTNPSFRDDWVKIGISAQPVNVRSKQLYNTAVPMPFEIYATIRTIEYEKVEKLVHDYILQNTRINPNREFFNVLPQRALAIFNQIALIIPDADVVEYKNNQPISNNATGSTPVAPKQTTPHRPRFKFSMVDIEIGEYVTFDPTKIKVKVSSDDSVEYQGRIYKLSPFVGTFLPADKRNTSGSYQGAKYFSYKGEILDDRRSRIEATKKLPQTVNIKKP